MQAFHFIVDAFFCVAVAVVIFERTVHAVVFQIIHGLDVLVAFLALFDTDLERMLVMTGKTGIHTIYMTEFRIVDLAIIFITGLRLRTV